MHENNTLKTGWLHFLYGLFVFQCVLMALQILAYIVQLAAHTPSYGSEEVYVLLLLLHGIRLVIKIAACATKYTEPGYKYLITTLLLDALGGVINGFFNGVGVGWISLVIHAAILLPNLLYVRKRKCLFGNRSKQD